MNLEELNNHSKEKMIHKEFGRSAYIYLRGNVKGEQNVRCHLLPSVAMNSRGVRVKASIDRLLALKN